MFWLFNNNNKDEYTYYQIFPFYQKHIDSNTNCINLLYDFTSNNKNNFDYTNLTHIQITYEIKVKGNIISFNNIKTNQQITFIKNEEFIKENHMKTSNGKIIDVPMFLYKYIHTENTKMPNILLKNYDFYYSTIIFDLYLINQKSIYVIETNKLIKRTYFLITNLDEY